MQNRIDKSMFISLLVLALLGTMVPASAQHHRFSYSFDEDTGLNLYQF